MDGIQVSNCTTELTGPTITLRLATPLLSGPGEGEALSPFWAWEALELSVTA